ncbi:hypothetical protein [Sorangium sp. So ce233]|uniref:hypothetical protein n=1 Tax=Sorangium sp. So ce233 TaxID=3133290 RepID=UPI003F63E7F2
MAGANGMSSKSGPTTAKSLNVVRLMRGKGERVMFTTDKSGRATMANSKGEMTTMGRGDARQRIANLTSPAGGFKVKAGGGTSKSAPKIAKLNMSGTTKFQVAGSGKLHKSEGAAKRAAGKVAKARANAKVATIKTAKGDRFQVPGSGKLYKSKRTAQKVAGEKAAEQALAS